MFIVVTDCALHELSGPPQEIEITVIPFAVSLAAVEIASANPWSVFGAK